MSTKTQITLEQDFRTKITILYNLFGNFHR